MATAIYNPLSGEGLQRALGKGPLVDANSPLEKHLLDKAEREADAALMAADPVFAATLGLTGKPHVV